MLIDAQFSFDFAFFILCTVCYTLIFLSCCSYCPSVGCHVLSFHNSIQQICATVKLENCNKFFPSFLLYRSVERGKKIWKAIKFNSFSGLHESLSHFNLIKQVAKIALYMHPTLMNTCYQYNRGICLDSIANIFARYSSLHS